MDDQTELARQKLLEIEREKLTEAQREAHDRFCALLQANETYKTEYAIKAAELIRTGSGIKLRADLQYLSQRADQQSMVETRLAWAEADKKKTPDAQEEADKSNTAQQDASAQKDEPQAVDEVTKQQRVDTAAQIQNKDEIAARAWVAQAESPERQQHQHGRYDALKGGNGGPGTGSSPPAAGPPPTPPRDPVKPTPTPPTNNGPLHANDVLQRFGNPAAEARYRQEDDRRTQAEKSAVSSADSATRTAARGDGDNARNTDLMAAFSKSAVKKKAEEAEAAKENGLTQTQSQGRGGRTR